MGKTCFIISELVWIDKNHALTRDSQIQRAFALFTGSYKQSTEQHFTNEETLPHPILSSGHDQLLLLLSW